MKTSRSYRIHALIPLVFRRAALVQTVMTIFWLGLLTPANAQQAPQGNLFVVPPNFAAGSNISSMVVADFNGDGKMDVAVTNAPNSGLGSVTVLLGNGDGTFQAPSTYAVGWKPSSIAVADFNGDHNLDIVVANTSGGGISILMGNGDGSFRPPVSYNANLPASSLAVGDFNGDGKLDVAVGMGPTYLAILFNNGDGTFGSPVSVSLGAIASGMAAGDLNGDGKLDLVIVSKDWGTIVLLGNGDGTFKSPSVFGLYPQNTVALADVNGDGRLDIITGSTNIGVGVWLGNGDGTFRSSSANWAAGESVAVGDLNGDGKPDIVGAGYGYGGGAGVAVLLGNGDGTFAMTKNYVGGSVCGALADFDGDGKLDYVTAAVTGIALFKGKGDGTFYGPVNYLNPSSDYISVTTGDFNGDGKLDFAAIGYASGTVDIFLGNGDDTFSPPVTYPAGSYAQFVTTGDFNGDGVLDLAAGGPDSGTISILLGKGDGTFQPAESYAVGGGAGGILVGDFNNDGKMDLAVAASSNFNVLLGNGDGTFQAPMSYNIGSYLSATGGIGDFNGDGNLDVVLIPSGATNVLVLLGNGDGTFKAPVSLAVGDLSTSAAVADLNHDGKPDVVVTTFSSNKAVVFLGNGDGSFQPGVSYATDDWPVAVAIADFNGDGIPDLVVGDEGTENLNVLIGNGDGTFQPATSYPAGQVTGIAVGDFRGGGIPDLVAASWGTVIYENVHGPLASLSPASLSFGNQTVGTTSTSQTVTLTNDGSTPFSASSITTTPDFSVTGTCAGVPAGQTCTLNVAFNPLLPLMRRGALTIGESGFIGYQAVTLTGTGVGPISDLSASSLSFGPQVVGTTTPSQTVTITNAGNGPLSITNIATTGDFAPTNTCSTPVAAGANCTVSVTFTPTIAGVRSGTLTITSNHNGTPGTNQMVTLSGTGTAAADTVAPALLDFGNQAYGSTSAALPVVVTNPGTSPLTISSITATSGFSPSTNCVGVVAAGATCTISVTFTPPGRGTATGTLTITSNAANSPSLVPLSGYGTSSWLLVSTSEAYFGDQVVGIPSQGYTLTVYNYGELALTITSMPITGNFTQTNNCAGGVAPAGNCTVTLFFVPTAVGAASGTLTFVDNAPQTSPVVTLSGTGTTTYDIPYMEYIVPSQMVKGGAAFTLTVNGADFGPASVVNWNGSARATTVVNGGQLTASISAADIAAAGVPLVTVTNPAPGGISSGYGFDILNPTPPLAFGRTDIPVGNNPQSLVTADFNGDGKVDLAVANGFDGTVSILLGNGDGTFGTHVDYPVSSNPDAIVVGDFNHDGKLDLAVASEGCPFYGGYCYGGAVTILLGQGDGTFQAQHPLSIASDFMITYLAAGDFNGDGKIDLAISEDATGTLMGGAVAIYLGQGDGTFLAGARYEIGPEYSQSPGVIAVKDFNNDGKLDLAVAEGAGSKNISILLGNGDGTFQTPVEYPTGADPFSIIATDLNGDGKLDLVIGNSNPAANSVSVLLGNGDGTFQTHIDYPAGVAPRYLALGDFNGDGKPDLITNNTGSNTFSLLLGNGDGTFQTNQDFVLGPNQYSLATADFNGDGQPDLAIGNFSSNTVSIYLLQNPIAGLSVTSVAFDNQAVGTTSLAQSVTLKNTGTLALAISAMSVTGDFTLASGTTCSTSAPVAAGSSCVINIAFVPTTVGSRSGTLTIADNAGGSPQTVSLSGTGTGPVASLSSALMFSAQLVNSTSGAQTVTLTNTGNASLTLTAIATSGPFAIAATGTTCSASTPVPASGTCTVAVTFTPTAGGSASGSLSFTDNAPGSPHSVGLSGTGQDFTLAPPSGSSSSQSVAPGQPASYTISLAGMGGLSGNVTFTCTGAPSEATCTISPNPAAAGSNVMVTVTTTAASLAAPRTRLLSPSTPGGDRLWLLALTAMLVALAFAHCHRKAVLWQIATLSFALLLMLALAACGGGGTSGGGSPSNPGTPAGTYTLTVTGTAGSGSSTLSHSMNLTLNVT